MTNYPNVTQESYDTGNPRDPKNPNLWPEEDELPGFRVFLERFFQHCHIIHMHLLQALEGALGLSENRLVSLCNDNHTELRLTHYPPIEIAKLATGTMSRISEHTDFGTFTLLFQDITGGLEVEDQNQDGNFIPIETGIGREMVVNVGDTLQRWTNDILRSTNHRVTIPISLKDKEEGLVIPARHSVAFFGKANRSSSLRCLSEFAAIKTPTFDEDVTAHEYNQRMVEKTYPLASSAQQIAV